VVEGETGVDVDVVAVVEGGVVEDEIPVVEEEDLIVSKTCKVRGTKRMDIVEKITRSNKFSWNIIVLSCRAPPKEPFEIKCRLILLHYAIRNPILYQGTVNIERFNGEIQLGLAENFNRLSHIICPMVRTLELLFRHFLVDSNRHRTS